MESGGRLECRPLARQGAVGDHPGATQRRSWSEKDQLPARELGPPGALLGRQGGPGHRKCDGPDVGGVRTWLFCASLAWSCFRVVLDATDKAVPTLIALLDQCLRRFGGVPTYALTDSEKTVTTDIVTRVPVRHLEPVKMGRHYGLSIATFVVAEADLVPAEANLLAAYKSFGELAAACEAFCDQVNARAHRSTRHPPAEMLAEERMRLHPLPARPYTAVFGVARTVGANTPVINFDGGEYSVPWRLRGEVVWPATTLVTSSSPPSRPGAPARSPATSGPRRVTPAMWTSTSAAPRARSTAPRALAPTPMPPSWPLATAPHCGLQKRRPWAPPGCGPRWPRRSRWPPCTAPGWWTGRSARRP